MYIFIHKVFNEKYNVIVNIDFWLYVGISRIKLRNVVHDRQNNTDRQTK